MAAAATAAAAKAAAARAVDSAAAGWEAAATGAADSGVAPGGAMGVATAAAGLRAIRGARRECATRALAVRVRS